MEKPNENPPANSPSSSNGVKDPMQRLASFRSPRDLSLGGVKLSKKTFAPNLNVSRNKNKGAELKTPDKKEEGRRNKKDHKQNDRQRKNGPNIIKSSGIFSEGMAPSERRSGSAGFGGGGGGFGGGGGSGRGGGGGARGGGDAVLLQKPVIRPNDVIKVDKQLEDECIRREVGDDEDYEQEDEKDAMRHDRPVKLPIGEFRRLNIQSNLRMPVMKAEPGVEVSEDVKPLIDVKTDLFEEKDIVTLLQSPHPTLILMQLPESMPGRGEVGDDTAPNQEDPQSNKCRLTSVAEGRMGQLRVHRSGRVRLSIGDTNFEVISGTKAMHYQELVSVGANPESRSARITAIGTLHHKLTVVPDWETLLEPAT